MDKETYLADPRFKGIEPFKNKVWLSSPTMHGDEQHWVDEAIQTNWVSTVGENINEVECIVVEKVVNYDAIVSEHYQVNCSAVVMTDLAFPKGIKFNSCLIWSEPIVVLRTNEVADSFF